MSWVAVGTTAVGVVGAYAKQDAAKGSSSGFMGGMGQSMTDASSATYGTTIGDDGWSINFGSGSQTANPVKTTQETYSDPMTMTPANPLTGMAQQLPRLPAASYTSTGHDPQTLFFIVLGGLLLLRHK